MKRKFCHSLFFFFLFIGSNAFAQNLIPDPSFEIYTPGNYSSFDYLGELDLWWTANATPDYHNENHPPGSNLTSLEDCPLGNGQTQCGVPFDGIATLGVYKANGSGGSKEWAATQFTEPMVNGECYIVSFWIQNKKDNPNYIMETSNWGVFFGSTGVPVFDPNTLDFDLVTDQYLTTTEILDSNDWRNYQWTYTANYDYEYFYIGYMGNTDDAITNAWSNDASIGYYVWFDMVMVIPVDSVEIDAIPDFELCQDSTAELSATCNVFYKWAWEDASGTTQFSDDSILVVSPTVTTTYYAFAGDYEACVKMDSIVVTVIDCSCLIPIETSTVVVNNTNCPLSETGNGMASVSAINGIEPYTYQWNDPLMQLNDTAFGLSGGNYICTVTDADGCTASAAVTITEGSIPDMTFVVTDESCVGSADGAIDLTVSNGYAPYAYLWSDNNSSTTQDIANLSTGYYAVTVTDNNNCPFTDSAFVDFAPLAQYQFPLICEGSPVTDLNFMGVSNGTWSGPGIIDPQQGLFDPAVSGVGVFTISFVSNVDCTDDFAMEVIVDALPNVNFTANAQSGCQPLTTLFSVANAGPDATYIWDLGDGNVSSNPQNVAFTYLNYGIYDVSLTITDSSGCSNSIVYNDYIEVYETPVADFNFTPEELDDVQSLAQFTSTSSDITTQWAWTFGDGGTSYQENPTHKYTLPGYYQVNLTATSDIGCYDIATNYIKYKDVILLYVPNAFTPNNDGRNDVFLCEARGEINVFSLKIFDRWGEMVFSTTDINTPWVGNKDNGDYYLNTEVFNYIIEYEAWGPQLEEPIGETIRGTVMLLK